MRLLRKSGPGAVTAGVAAVVLGASALTACGSDGDSEPSGGPSTVTTATTATTTATAGADGIDCGKAAALRASGSTAQAYAMRFWIRNYTRACPGTRIDYRATGSGTGQADFLAGRTAFAGSDSVLSDAQVKQSKSVCSDGGHAVHLPVLGGPIAVGFHLPGVSRLVLDAPALARLFTGEIDKWNDPAIAKLNPGVKLPSLPVTAFHRSDSSGTTDNFTAYLSAAAPGAWTHGHSKEWKPAGGRSADGSAGLAAQVKRTDGAIGYFELSYAVARSVPTASIDTGAPSPAEANVLAASKAIADARIAGSGSDLVLRLDYATKESGAYPIDLVTYEIVCDKGNKASTWPALKSFLTYIAGSRGQEDLSFQGYATLPAPIVDRVRKEIAKLS